MVREINAFDREEVHSFSALIELFRLVAAMATQMEPADAARLTARAAGKALALAPRRGVFGTALILPLEELARQMGTGEATVTFSEVLEIVAREENETLRRNLVRMAVALAPRLGPRDAQQAAGRTLTALAKEGDRLVRHHLVVTIGALATKLTDQGLVEILKNPTCVGVARRPLLKEIGQRVGREFTDVWQFVRWAREHRRDLDLSSPPAEAGSD